MPRALIAALAVLATTLMLAACGENKTTRSSSSGSSWSLSSDSGKVDPNAPAQEGHEDGLDPEAARQPLRGVETPASTRR